MRYDDRALESRRDVKDGTGYGWERMTAILGISAFYHDSAAALVIDGRIVAAAQEERFTRIKHDSAFPTQAIDFCLKAGGALVRRSRLRRIL